MVNCTPATEIVTDLLPSGPGEKGEGWAKVHHSHQRMLIQNVLFCAKCGYYMVHKPQALAAQCIGKPKHADGRAKLKRLLQGLHPDRKVDVWPDGACTRIPVEPLHLDH